ncbi:hypothetical protein C8A00DRAFT_43538 [Chaetomidium leptoderma]|uniref:Zn(2)-C6 fungal-type domain-containing protein n=1 Tax=Chaetomidium leptoderma TaxID=669021 RepID=A0AAN6VLV5_9PEZI|nr:hypothetical protein C8A00DRAFT_43538 [Chaetomidium leptoderma]
MSEPSTSPDTEVGPREQCWECRRRRLVCDGTQPVCNKCRAARIVCPGYADKKPLTWLAPGQVMSRTRKRKTVRKGGSTGSTGSKKQQPKDKAAPNEPNDSDSTFKSSDGSQLDGSQPDEADLFLPVEMRPEVCDVFEAMLYYNQCIFPELAQYQLGPSAFLLPLIVLQGVPPSIVHTLVSVVLSHRIIRMADDPATNQLVKPMWTRLYRHRDIAVRAINKRISNKETRKNIATLIAVYTLLFATLQQSFTPCWRTHADALMSLVHLWGPFPDVIRDIPDMELSMMAICM